MSHSLALRFIELRVPDLARSQAFYVGLGFHPVDATGQSIGLAVAAGEPPVLRLIGAPNGKPPPPSAAGLFHAALLFPGRAALGGWLRHALEKGIELDGASDHAVSEALYFSDPDGNGLEFYADRPREAWPFVDGQVAMVTERLDLGSLLAAAAPSPVAPLAGAKWGHLHLRVTNLERSERFYTEALGLQVTQRTYPGARFLAADGYHHHLGLNVWSRPTEPQPPDSLGLARATFVRRNVSEARELHDPDGIAIGVEPLTIGA